MAVCCISLYSEILNSSYVIVKVLFKPYVKYAIIKTTGNYPPLVLSGLFVSNDRTARFFPTPILPGHIKGANHDE